MLKVKFVTAIGSAVGGAISLSLCFCYVHPCFADRTVWPQINKVSGELSPKVCIAEVQKLQVKGKDEEIVKLLNHCLRDRPDVAALYFYRAQALMKLKRFKEAIFDCSAQIKLEPQIYKPYEMRAQCYLALKERQKAFKDLKRAVELEPGDGYAHEQLALYYKQVRAVSNWKKEMALFKSGKVVASKDKSMPVPAVLTRHDHPFAKLLDRAQVNLALKRPGLVLDDCKQLLAFSDQDIAVEHINRGDIYELQAEAFQQMDIHDQAVLAFNQVLKYKPGEKRVYYLRAGSNFALGKYEDCIADCERAGKGDKMLSDTVAQLRAKAVSHLKH